MLTATNIRKLAREALSGKWGKGALITFCYALVEFAFEILMNYTENTNVIGLVVSIIVLLISIPLSYGLLVSFMKLKRGEDVGAFDFITIGFSSFSRAWKVFFSMLKKLILPVILMVASVVFYCVGTVLIIYYSNRGLIDAQTLVALSSSSNGLAAIIMMIISFVLLIGSSIWMYVIQLHYILSYNIAYDEPELETKDVVLKSKSLMQGNRCNYFVLTLSFIGWAILAAFTFGIGYLWLLPYIQVSTVCFYDTLKAQ